LTNALGTFAAVAYIRGFLQNNPPYSFPLLLERVVYSGTHSGDWIAASDAPQLVIEARSLKSLTNDPVIVQFTNDAIELAEASIATGPFSRRSTTYLCVLIASNASLTRCRRIQASLDSNSAQRA
jgi:hypothetical protein